MRADRIELPQPSTPTVAEPNHRMSKPKLIGNIAFVLVSLILIAFVHIQTERVDGQLSALLLLRRLYIAPIVYAAWVFGKRGGLAAAAGASIPYISHAQTVAGANSGRSGFDNWVEVVSYFALGLMFGILRDLEVERSRDFLRVSTELSDAYRKLEERAIQLMNVQDYTSSILRSIASGVFTVSPDGSLATANPAAERMLGMSEYEMVPKPVSQVFDEDDGLAEDIAKVLAGRVPLLMRDATVTTKAGVRIHVQASTSRMETRGGDDLGAVVTIEDISELRALTDQLIRADRLAAMGELTAGVAHEVRNPLGIIRARVQLLESTDCDEAQIRRASEVIKQEIDRLDKVIKALLDFGRPSRPMLVRSDLRSVLTDVVLFTEHFARQASVRMEIEGLDDELPVLGDPDQLKQVFLNLVTNAVQAMEETGGAITIRAGKDGDYVTVTVSDNGPGIAADELRKIFDPFFTLRAEGTGLGLTIVHRIIDAHDGHIRVESTRGKGTTFTVTLPLSRQDKR